MTKRKTIREAALDILVSVEKNNAYSNLLLNQTIQKNGFSERDAGLLTEITYGTLQHKMTIDFYLAPFIKKQKRIMDWVRQLLRLSVFQLAYLTKIPDHAVIHEAVEIAKVKGHKGISGFVNGVLRSIQREGLPSLDSVQDPLERLSVETSHPLWLVKRWTDQYGLGRTKAMCQENLQPGSQTARVNRWRADLNSILHRLEREGYNIETSRLPEAIKSVKGNLAASAVFREGLITIQDESSMIAAYAVDPKEDERILDMCAAPGGKTTHMAEKMKNTGTIIALDLHPHKVKLIEENRNRLGLTNIKSEVMDARNADKSFPREYFDRILVDAPCSGLGVVKRKPDIKYSKTEEDIQRLAQIQSDILDHASRLVKRGGLLVYSTCTTDKAENQEVARRFLEGHPDFAKDESLIERMPEAVKPFVRSNQVEILPQDMKSDGFFIACFIKKL